MKPLLWLLILVLFVLLFITKSYFDDNDSGNMWKNDGYDEDDTCIIITMIMTLM